MATLPQWTQDLDNAFLQTWYDIRPDAIDNILLATVVWAFLKEKGCFKTQTGSVYITRNARYAVGNATSAVAKGDTLPMGVTETETMAKWTFRNLAVAIQRDLITDAENAGPSKIKDYVKQRLGEARDSMTQQLESDVMRAVNTAETGKYIQSLKDILPPYASSKTGTYGGIARPTAYAEIAASNGVYAPSAGNTWWGPLYKQLTLPMEQNLVTDMKVLFNSVTNNQESPSCLMCDQGIYELYEEFAVDKTQIVKNDRGMLADLGFQTLEFKGKPMFWTPNSEANTIRFLNTDYIEVVYRPNLWFAMTGWKDIPLQMERIAHIISGLNIIGTQPRRHGMLTDQTVS